MNSLIFWRNKNSNSIPASVEKLFIELRDEIHESRELLEKIKSQQQATNKKISALESKLLSSLSEQSSLELRRQKFNPSSKATKPVPSKSLERISVELSNELRIYLENNSFFDQESWLELWQGNPAACDLAKRLVFEYLPLKAATMETYYDIGVWLKKAYHKIDLIIPKLNDEFDSNQHEMVKQLQQKGPANRVQEVKRLGLACDDSVLVKAQVVSS
jgi:molecular chaperone GrpE (heat shock protein)